MAVGTSIFIALNDAMGWGFSQDTIQAMVTVIVGWIAVEGATDIIKKKPAEVALYDSKILDTVRKDSEGA